MGQISMRGENQSRQITLPDVRLPRSIMSASQTITSSGQQRTGSRVDGDITRGRRTSDQCTVPINGVDIKDQVLITTDNSSFHVYNPTLCMQTAMRALTHLNRVPNDLDLIGRADILHSHP
jgi:hypothetical protein